MKPRRQVQWIIDEGPSRPARVYTIQLLCSLIGAKPVMLGANQNPDPSLPTVRYTRTEGAATAAQLAIRPDAGFWESVASGASVAPRKRASWHGTELPIWSPAQTDTGTDPIAAAFFLVSRIEEWRGGDRDRHGRFRASDAWMVRENLIERPLVHEYAGAIANAVGITEPFAPVRAAWPNGKRFVFACTHDIDRMRMHGPLWQDCRRALGALRFPGGRQSAINRFRSRRLVTRGDRNDPYDTFGRLASAHESRGHRATFLWINAAASVRNADYRCDDPEVRELIRNLHGRGFEIGLHGSYETFERPAALTTQKEGLEESLGCPVTAIRQHYLRLQPDKTWRAHAAAGFRVDSTLGFAERMGFRAGIAAPFQPWDFAAGKPFDLWEVPLIMMDGTAREYMRLGIEDAIARSRTILERAAAVGGIACSLWHNSSLDDVDWPGWDAVYESWQDTAVELGAWGATLTEVAGAWEQYYRKLMSAA